MKSFMRAALLLSTAMLIPASVFAQTAPVAPVAASAAVPPQIVLNVTKSANLRDLANASGYDGHTPANYAFVVPKDVNVLGALNGGRGIDTGVWPTDTILVLVIAGNVYGGGGKGGDGGDIPGAQDGGRGGDAIYVQAPIGVAITKTGSVKAGGGGGGGAAGAGSGGGGGFPNGGRGELGNATFGGEGGAAGQYGTPSGGGKGGQKGSIGGDGGNAGMAGGSAARAGGGEGFAIRTNGIDVTLTNEGDMRGQIG